MPKPSEEDIQHCFGVIGAQTSQPDSTRPTRTYKTLPLKKSFRLYATRNPSVKFSPYISSHFPQKFLSPHVSEKSNQECATNIKHPCCDCVPPLQLRAALSLQFPVQLIIPEEFPRPAPCVSELFTKMSHEY